MTANQIAYAKLREETRYHMEDEAIRRKANDLTQAGLAVKSEEAATSRMRAYNESAQNELRRQELQQNYILQSQRLAQDAALESARQTETQRHNYASEQEATRSRETSQQIASTQTRAGILTGLLNTAGSLIRAFAK